ncbi:hypothetical protein K8I61_20500 [bacterium]|nr:hypothetical protein [bacterium]
MNKLILAAICLVAGGCELYHPAPQIKPEDRTAKAESAINSIDNNIEQMKAQNRDKLDILSYKCEMDSYIYNNYHLRYDFTACHELKLQKERDLKSLQREQYRKRIGTDDSEENPEKALKYFCHNFEQLLLAEIKLYGSMEDTKKIMPLSKHLQNQRNITEFQAQRNVYVKATRGSLAKYYKLGGTINIKKEFEKGQDGITLACPTISPHIFGYISRYNLMLKFK